MFTLGTSMDGCTFGDLRGLTIPYLTGNTVKYLLTLTKPKRYILSADFMEIPIHSSFPPQTTLLSLRTPDIPLLPGGPP